MVTLAELTHEADITIERRVNTISITAWDRINIPAESALMPEEAAAAIAARAFSRDTHF